MAKIKAAQWSVTRKGNLPAEVQWVSYQDMYGQPGKPVQIYRLIGSDAWITQRAYDVANLRWKVEQKRAKEAGQ